MKSDNLIITGKHRTVRGWLPWRKVIEMQIERVVLRRNGEVERRPLWVRASPNFLGWL